ncbi:scoloptoxin SSD14-like isoform X2 [Paramacrobiotus metropolitanus]|uniref:scoloptoxin SSD14-like isoform X2 n=2 Tax=Paramacrobiotus metropolitanus TaxID=2943436 RepID=UPI0024463C7D|nr:scoloptoxin SSD14-like isoform X2 [Paramacrobiotus metropolitanus]
MPASRRTSDISLKTMRMSRKKRITMVAGVSLLVLLLSTGIVVGTYYGVKNNNVREEHKEFPGAVDTDIPPSNSTLGKFSQQAVAADAAECSVMGNDILKSGGNAIEAAITTALCSGVYHPHSCGIGGGFFMVIYDRRSGNSTAIDAREVAPAAATQLMFVENKNISSIKGWHAAGVPGEIAGLWAAYEYSKSIGGRLSWSDLFQPVIKVLEEGVRINHILASAIRDASKDILQYDEGLTELFSRNGTVFVENDMYTNKDLAATMRKVANDPRGVEEFYRGAIAQDLAKDIAEGGGIITLQDLNSYVANIKPALKSVLNDGSSVLGVPPPAGSLIMQYIVQLMDGYYGLNGNATIEWKTAEQSERDLYNQRFTEAMKFGYARRTEMGDEDFVPDVDRMKQVLLSPWFASLTRRQIMEDKTSQDPRTYGIRTMSRIGKHGTSHLSVVDKNGNAVSLTTTINTHFGSRRVSRQTGIILNNEMDDFSVNPHEPNYYGLPPSPSNFIAPGKRPQSSCSPTIVTDPSGNVNVVIGASGGSRIISATANALSRILYTKQNVKESIDAPRLHHQLLPMQVEYEPGMRQDDLRTLSNIGHKLRMVEFPYAVVQGIHRLPDGSLQANSDHRKAGSPAGE